MVGGFFAVSSAEDERPGAVLRWLRGIYSGSSEASHGTSPCWMPLSADHEGREPTGLSGRLSM
jgi:hypothetical protein